MSSSMSRPFFFFLNLCDSCIVYERVHAPLMHALISVRARFGEYLRSERRRERTRAHTRVAELSKKKSVGSYLMTPQISPKIKFSKCTEFIFFLPLLLKWYNLPIFYWNAKIRKKKLKCLGTRNEHS